MSACAALGLPQIAESDLRSLWKRNGNAGGLAAGA
jgi:hypothetical protein